MAKLQHIQSQRPPSMATRPPAHMFALALIVDRNTAKVHLSEPTYSKCQVTVTDLLINLVHRLKIFEIGKKDIHFDDVVQSGPSCFEYFLDILQSSTLNKVCFWWRYLCLEPESNTYRLCSDPALNQLQVPITTYISSYKDKPP